MPERGVVWCGIPSLRSIKTRAHSFVIRVTISARYDDDDDEEGILLVVESYLVN